jgi:hypothetical protein
MLMLGSAAVSGLPRWSRSKAGANFMLVSLPELLRWEAWKAGLLYSLVLCTSSLSCQLELALR